MLNESHITTYIKRWIDQETVLKKVKRKYINVFRIEIIL